MPLGGLSSGKGSLCEPGGMTCGSITTTCASAMESYPVDDLTVIESPSGRAPSFLLMAGIIEPESLKIATAATFKLLPEPVSRSFEQQLQSSMLKVALLERSLKARGSPSLASTPTVSAPAMLVGWPTSNMPRRCCSKGLSFEPIIFAGPVLKRSRFLRIWRERWAVLVRGGILFFPNSDMEGSPTEQLVIEQDPGIKMDGNVLAFRSRGCNKLMLKFEDASQIAMWAGLFEDAVTCANAREFR